MIEICDCGCSPKFADRPSQHLISSIQDDGSIVFVRTCPWCTTDSITVVCRDPKGRLDPELASTIANLQRNEFVKIVKNLRALAEEGSDLWDGIRDQLS